MPELEDDDEWEIEEVKDELQKKEGLVIWSNGRTGQRSTIPGNQKKKTR
jgi:hypothetical protein